MERICLKAFVDLLQNGEKKCVIWITDNVFVRQGGLSNTSLPGVYRDQRIRLALYPTRSLAMCPLDIHSSTLEEAASCLFLQGFRILILRRLCFLGMFQVTTDVTSVLLRIISWIEFFSKTLDGTTYSTTWSERQNKAAY
jgi:hypothetical protein